MSKVTGETSDGYHTFNELYDYRIEVEPQVVKVVSDEKASN